MRPQKPTKPPKTRDLARSLRLWRRVRELTQTEVHKVTGIHNTRLSALENGRIQAQTVELTLLAQAYGISVEALCEGPRLGAA